MSARDLYDAVVIGGGPAGLAAAVYLARSRHRVVVVERERFGGQIATTSEVVNYPGVERVSGPELAETMRRQAERFGAEFIAAEATGLDLAPPVRTVRTTRGDLRCFGVLLATGARPRAVGFDGEERFRGRGVAYCATCDGEFFAGRDVFVIGGSFQAAEESVFLTRYARHVTVMIRRDGFSCAASAAEEAARHPKMTVMPHTEVVSVDGDSVVRSMRYKNNQTGEVTEYRPDDGGTFGVFVLAGRAPETALIKGLAELDEAGYVVTDRGQRTTADGLYAAGDICVKPLRQVVTAVSDGATAATELERLAASARRETGLTPEAPEAQSTAPSAAPSGAPNEADGAILTGDMRAQLGAMFERMASRLVLEISADDRPASAELRRYLDELAALTDKITVRAASEPDEHAPCVRVLREDGAPTGIAFHGVPGGHEFTSFALALYNAAGPGQALDDALRARARSIAGPVRLGVLVSLSCTMCPETVAAAQRIAALNDAVTAEAYDIALFPDLREKYNVMSVPCVLRDDAVLAFGKKSVSELLDLLGA